MLTCRRELQISDTLDLMVHMHVELATGQPLGCMYVCTVITVKVYYSMHTMTRKEEPSIMHTSYKYGGFLARNGCFGV